MIHAPVPTEDFELWLVVPITNGEDSCHLGIDGPADGTPEQFAKQVFELKLPTGFSLDWTPAFRMRRRIKKLTDADVERSEKECATKRSAVRRMASTVVKNNLDPNDYWQDDWKMTREILEILLAKQSESS